MKNFRHWKAADKRPNIKEISFDEGKFDTLRIARKMKDGGCQYVTVCFDVDGVYTAQFIVGVRVKARIS